MSLWSTALRAALSLGLILNGSSIALAASGIHSGMGSDSHLASAESPGPEVELPCHEMVSVGANESSHGTVPVKSAPSDCCKPGSCNCDCYHAAAAIPACPMSGVAVIRDPARSMPDSGHISPVLTEQIRPPIS
ncbi:CopL family metal-binding regulatory protein [Dokdonella sp.]|uniref:CopL family metal-binding regulatory protein n=1 Tax=Dokdonella sp. TaxID=2291710 RepID=UPI003526D085